MAPAAAAGRIPYRTPAAAAVGFRTADAGRERRGLPRFTALEFEFMLLCAGPVTCHARLKLSKRRVDPGQVQRERPIERAFFRETEDGTTIFFPWGLNHRGYRLTDDAAKVRATRAASFLISVTIGIGVWTAHALQPILESEGDGPAEVLDAIALPGAAFLLALVAYTSWISRFVECLPESDFRVSREERLCEAAELVKPWKIALVGAVFCGLSALCIWLQPHTWWFGLLGVALGIGILLWSEVLRRAAADGRD